MPEPPKGMERQVPTRGGVGTGDAEVAQNQVGNVESGKERNNFYLKLTT